MPGQKMHKSTFYAFIDLKKKTMIVLIRIYMY
jgi:hypothetical protein